AAWHANAFDGVVCHVAPSLCRPPDDLQCRPEISHRLWTACACHVHECALDSLSCYLAQLRVSEQRHKMPADLGPHRRRRRRLEIHELFLLPALEKLGERQDDARPIVRIVNGCDPAIEFPARELLGAKLVERSEILSSTDASDVSVFEDVLPPTADPDFFFTSLFQ